jgi:hypothetical protein
MNRQEILLKEYEVCQQHINTLGTQNWQSAGIFLAADALITGFVFGLKPHDEWSFAAVLAIGLAFIFIFLFWKLWLKRQKFVQLSLYVRMRDIEVELGMWKNWYAFLPDEFDSDEEIDNSTLPKEKKGIIKYLRKYYAKAAGYEGLVWIARIVMFSWVFIIIREGILAFTCL